MKKIFYLISCFLFLVSNLNAQNLVPNPSFETTTSSSLGGGIYLHLLPPWDSPTDGTADGFNVSSGMSLTGVPSNNFGYQYPLLGNGYAGAGFYNFINNREYLQVQLDTPLVDQEHYCVSFYVNHSNRSRFAVNNIGIYFSTTHTYVAGGAPLNFIPQINYTNVISDDSIWTIVSGQYVSHGGEKYIIIGNFYSDSLTNTAQVHGIGSTIPEAYYYIDDVNVHCCTCDSTTSLHDGVEEIKKQSAYKLYPNPNTGKMTLEYKIESNETTTFAIYSIDGRMVKQETLNSQNTSLNIDASQLDAGVYYYVVKEGSKKAKAEKLVIVK